MADDVSAPFIAVLETGDAPVDWDAALEAVDEIQSEEDLVDPEIIAGFEAVDDLRDALREHVRTVARHWSGRPNKNDVREGAATFTLNEMKGLAVGGFPPTLDDEPEGPFNDVFVLLCAGGILEAANVSVVSNFVLPR